MWSARFVPLGPSSRQSGALRVFLSRALFLIPLEGCEPSLALQQEALSSSDTKHSFLLCPLVPPFWVTLAFKGHTAP